MSGAVLVVDLDRLEPVVVLVDLAHDGRGRVRRCRRSPCRPSAFIAAVRSASVLYGLLASTTIMIGLLVDRAGDLDVLARRRPAAS